MDLAMIKSLTAQIKNQDIDLSVTKDALYRNMFHTTWPPMTHNYDSSQEKCKEHTKDRIITRLNWYPKWTNWQLKIKNSKNFVENWTRSFEQLKRVWMKAKIIPSECQIQNQRLSLTLTGMVVHLSLVLSCLMTIRWALGWIPIIR